MGKGVKNKPPTPRKRPAEKQSHPKKDPFFSPPGKWGKKGSSPKGDVGKGGDENNDRFTIKTKPKDVSRKKTTSWSKKGKKHQRKGGVKVKKEQEKQEGIDD